MFLIIDITVGESARYANWNGLYNLSERLTAYEGLKDGTCLSMKTKWQSD